MEYILCNHCNSKNAEAAIQCFKCEKQIRKNANQSPDTNSRSESIDEVSSLKQNGLSISRFLLFILFALIGTILLSVSLGFISELDFYVVNGEKYYQTYFFDSDPLYYEFFKTSYFGYFIYAIFAIFFWLSLTILIKDKFRLKSLGLSIMSWSFAYYGFWSILSDHTGDILKVFVPATIATFIATLTIKKEIIGNYSRFIISLGWGIAIWTGSLTAEDGLLFFKGSGFEKAISTGLNIAIVGIVISLIAQQLRFKGLVFSIDNNQIFNISSLKKSLFNIKYKLKSISQNNFSNSDKQTFLIALLLTITSFFLPFYRNSADSYFVIDEWLFIIPYIALLILNIIFVTKRKPFISTLLSNILYLTLIVIPFLLIKRGANGSGGLFFDESEYSTDLGFYLFVFSIFLSVYTINKNRILTSEKNGN